MPDRTALVTGVSRSIGLGFAVTRLLAERGYQVIVTARRLEQAEQLAAALRAENLPVSAVRLDLSDPAGIDRAAEQIAAAVPRLDVLVNNASTFPDFRVLSALEADTAEVAAALQVDVLGPWRLVQLLLPLLHAAPAARIVMVSSVAARQLDADPAGRHGVRAPAHSFGKHTLEVLTSALAAELADTPILVNAVDPGEIASHPERGDEDDARPAAESAAGVVWAATLPADGPRGGLFRDGEPVA